MPKIRFVSNNKLFEQDFKSQIVLHAPDFSLAEHGEMFDLIVVDEDIQKYTELVQNNKKTPAFFICTQNENIIKTGIQITKPVKLADLIAQIRSTPQLFGVSKKANLKFGQFEVVLGNREIINVSSREKARLTEREIEILRFLYKNKGHIVSKATLLKEVWKYSSDATTHTVETHIYRMRQKIEKAFPGNRLIETVDGHYKLIY